MLLAWSGQQVSRNTTLGVAGDVLLKDKHFSLNKVSHDLTQALALNDLVLLSIKVPFYLLISTWRDLHFARQASGLHAACCVDCVTP
jgi:hypothetical protein